MVSDVYGAGRSYEADLLAQARNHGRTMQWIAAAATGVAVFFGAGLAFMASQHTVTSHVVSVDKATGMAEVLSITNMRDIPMQGIEAMAWARRYVNERERYNYGIVQSDYNSTVALSDDEVARRYDAEARARVDKLAGNSEELVRILTVTLPPDQVGRAIVRFEKRSILAKQDPGGSPWRPYIATLAYQFVPAPTGSRDALSLNPLGFKVTSYIAEPELAGR